MSASHEANGGSGDKASGSLSSHSYPNSKDFHHIMLSYKKANTRNLEEVCSVFHSDTPKI